MLPTTNTGLLILREDGELVASSDVPEVNGPDPSLFDEPIEAELMPAVELSLTDDLALPEPPPLPPPRPALPQFQPVFTDRPPQPPPHVIVGSPVAAPLAAGASSPRISGKTVADSGLRPMSTRVTGVPSTEDVVDVVTTPRRMPVVRPRPIKERDRRGPGEVEAALPNVQAAPSAPGASSSKAEAFFLQALTDHQMGNDVAAENGIKLALTYAPGDARYQDALKRLRSGQILVD